MAQPCFEKDLGDSDELAKMAPITIDQILAHGVDHAREKTSPALESHMLSQNILEHIESQKKAAVDLLATIDQQIGQTASAGPEHGIPCG